MDELNLDHLTPLTPLSYLERSATVYGDRQAVVDGDVRLTYRQLHERTKRLAGGLAGLGVEPGGRVAFLSPNTHALLEAHYGVPAAGALLVAMNTRLAPAEFGHILEHSGADVLVFDQSLAGEAHRAAEIAGTGVRLIESGGPGSEYERLLDQADSLWLMPDSETSALSINYTSGTTGLPKGVVYHHRGAFLQALAMAYHARLGLDSVYLWTLPMFHTNGWCFPWAVTAAGARHRCLHRVDPGEIWRAIRTEGVTHLCAAPTVLIMLADHPDAAGGAPRPISVMTGGAPPTPALLERLASLGIDVVHLYGLTETFGPAAICDWRPEWSELPVAEQARIKARQGVGNVISGEVRVVDLEGTDVPHDGETIGEIAISGNNVMAGYYRDPDATAAAIPDGWFRTGDLAVKHPDGYVEIRDRKKDIIISGGENISSVEIERVLAAHPAVYEAAVIGEPDPKWGEVPVAVVEVKQGAHVSEEDLIEFVRGKLARFKAPRRVEFGALPRTSTGKIQKHMLRRRSGD
ncbi:MAG TPA: acyl--CoA ligase family protein [Acidimicrobiia bacterium]|nr:acyl--CoA ligase family protein [Acidimicrobiia bacterium]